VTARLRCDAALYAHPHPHQTAGPPTGQRRPTPGACRAGRHDPLPVDPRPGRCYGTTLDREVLAIRCLWHGALGGQLVQVVLSRPLGAPDGYQLALVTTDLAATPAMIIERYADRWSAETMFLVLRSSNSVREDSPPVPR
jgi:hypothetical protein